MTTGRTKLLTPFLLCLTLTSNAQRQLNLVSVGSGSSSVGTAYGVIYSYQNPELGPGMISLRAVYNKEFPLADSIEKRNLFQFAWDIGLLYGVRAELGSSERVRTSASIGIGFGATSGALRTEITGASYRQNFSGTELAIEAQLGIEIGRLMRVNLYGFGNYNQKKPLSGLLICFQVGLFSQQFLPDVPQIFPPGRYQTEQNLTEQILFIPAQRSDKGERFVEAALSRLKPTREISLLYSKWQKDKTEELFVKLSANITSLSKEQEVTSFVTISTKTEGATVKYQTVGDRKFRVGPSTAKKPTICEQEMYIGYYHIWSERDGRATSDTTSTFSITSEKESVRLDERF